jgi:hypothetical protein
VHALNAAPSKLQLKVEPDSLDEKVNVADVENCVPVGPESIVVSGAAVSPEPRPNEEWR